MRVGLGLLGLLLAAGCAAHVEDGPETDRPAEPAFGLGGKADEGACPPEAELCWPSAQQLAMRRLIALRQDALLGERTASEALGASLEALGPLRPKLGPEDEGAFGRAEAAADEAEAAAALQVLWEGPLQRLHGWYLAAHGVPLGASAEAERRGAADEGSAASAREEETAGAGYSEGMVESLRRMRASGLAGRAYATLLEASGALDRRYEVAAPPSFALPATGTAPWDERVDGVVRRHALVAGASGAAGGAVSLVPVAGIILSVPLGGAMSFAIHLRMTLTVAAAQGWDVREGANLYVVTMFLLSDEALEEVGAELAASVSMPGLLQALGRTVGVRLSTTASIKLAAPLLTLLTRYLARKGQQLLAELSVDPVRRAALGQVLGWATMGLNVLASGVADYWVTSRIGEHVALVSRPWLWTLPVDATTVAGEPAARRCELEAVAALLRADGELTGREERYFQGLLATPLPGADGSWRRMGREERRRLTEALRDGTGRLDEGCLRRWFAEREPLRKLVLLSHLYGAAAIDGGVVAPEWEAYAPARELLAGDGWFDGPMVEPYQLDYVERVVRHATGLDPVEVGEEYRDQVDALSTEARLGWLEQVPPDIAADFASDMATP